MLQINLLCHKYKYVVRFYVFELNSYACHIIHTLGKNYETD